MKLVMLPADKGDCLLLTSADDRRMLIDGGMSKSYSEFVAPELGNLREQGLRIEVVCVSHIDRDHISGVLQMFEDELAWRVHEFQITHGNPWHKPPTELRPSAIRPPEVGSIWHNAFNELVRDNAGPIEQALAAQASVLSASEAPDAIDLAELSAELATSVPEAITLSRRIGGKQLRIPLNPEYEGRLMIADGPKAVPIELGSLKVSVIGPFKKDLDELRDEWNEWLTKKAKQLKDVQRRAKQAEDSLISTEADLIIDRANWQAVELEKSIRDELAQMDPTLAEHKLGRRSKVTVPNLASLMLYVEEKDGQTLLLTGDGHSDEVLAGLKKLNKLDAQGKLHVHILKVQHHGAEFNMKEDFAGAITADHYVLCANGAHHNPDLRILDLILDARLKAPEGSVAAGKFTIWLNSSSDVTEDEANKRHMKRVETRLAERANPQFKTVFRTMPSGGIEIGGK